MKRASLPLQRREFITLLGGAVAGWPLAARAQQGERVRRIGALIGALPEGDPETMVRVKVLRQALESHGWSEGRNLRIDFRWPGAEIERIRRAAADLVTSAPDVIFAHTTPATTAVLEATRSISIVFASVSDPVGDGIVASFPRPGGNVTGFTNVEATMGGKWLEILKELAPGLTRVGFMFNRATGPGGGVFFLRPFEAAAPSFKVQPIAMPIEDVADIERAVMSLAAEPHGGLIVNSDAFTTLHRTAIVDAAARHRVPTVYPFVYFAEAGGLVAYGTSVKDLWRRAASYLDRILKGEKPADLPVQAPTKFELAINLKTAKALGIEVPPSVLVRADEVIE